MSDLDLTSVFGVTVPIAFVKRNSEVVVDSVTLKPKHLEFLKQVLATGIPVFTSGMEDTGVNIREPGDYRKRSPKATGLKSGHSVVAWQPASGLIRCSRNFLRLHGRGLGEPGLILPAQSQLILRRGRREVEAAPGSGLHTVMFRRKSRSHTGSGHALEGMVGAGAGYICGRLFRTGKRERAGVYSISARNVGDRDEIVKAAATSSVFGVVAIADYVQISVSGPAADIAEQVFRNRIPTSLYFCDTEFWRGVASGLLYGKSEGVIKVPDPKKAATLLRLLCRAGLGYRTCVGVYRDHIEFVVDADTGDETVEDVVWKNVKIDEVELPFSMSVPAVENWLVHCRGCVFRIPVL